VADRQTFSIVARQLLMTKNEAAPVPTQDGAPVDDCSVREAELCPQPVPKSLTFLSVQQLIADLERHRDRGVDIYADNAIDLVAALKGVDRDTILRTAISSWFYHALGFRILEAECHGKTPQTAADQLSFRLRLDANHDGEEASLVPGQVLGDKYRNALVAALPVEIANTMHSRHDKMVEISWTAPGSVELGGVASLGLITMMVMSMTVGLGVCCFDKYRQRDMTGEDSKRRSPQRAEVLVPFGTSCPCVSRHSSMLGSEYQNALRDLRARGAEFKLGLDGSVSLSVPPHQDSLMWTCHKCIIM